MSNMRVRRTSTGAPSKISGAQKTIDTPQIGRVTFREILDEKNDDERRKALLQELLDEVEDKGRELVENRTVESLFAYKELVKSFVEEAVDYGLKLAEKRGYGRVGRNKILRSVENIDEKLLQLTDLVLQKETKHINILGKVGEIKGLLVNLYL